MDKWARYSWCRIWNSCIARSNMCLTGLSTLALMPRFCTSWEKRSATNSPKWRPKKNKWVTIWPSIWNIGALLVNFSPTWKGQVSKSIQITWGSVNSEQLRNVRTTRIDFYNGYIVLRRMLQTLMLRVYRRCSRYFLHLIRRKNKRRSSREGKANKARISRMRHFKVRAINR